MDFIKENYLWFIGVFLALIAIIQTWRANRLNKINARRRNLSLYYKIKKKVTFEDLPEKVEVSYNNKSFSKISYTEFIFGNNGNVTLLNTDINETVKITSDKPIKILSYAIIDYSKDENKFTIEKHKVSESDIIEIKFKKLFIKDSVKFYLLYIPSSNEFNFNLEFVYNNECNLDSKKVNDVSYFDHPMYHGPDNSWIGVLFLSAYGAFAYFSFIYTQQLVQTFLQNSLRFTRVASEIISFFFALIPTILISLLIYIIIKKDIFKLNDKVETPQSPFGRGFKLLK